MNASDANIELRCGVVVDWLLVQHGWKLLDRHEFIARVVVAAREHPAADLAYLAFGVYNHALYDACSGAEGPDRWNLAYTELYRLLYSRAQLKYPDIFEDAVQSALERTAESFERCVEARAFFEFAWGHLRNATRNLRPHLRRKDKRDDISLEQTIGAEDERTLRDSLADPHADVEEQVLTAGMRIEMRTILEEFEHTHPRAKNQLAAVRLKYLDGQDDETISQILSVPVKRVHELRSLGLKKLRSDMRLRRLLGYEDA